MRPAVNPRHLWGPDDDTRIMDDGKMQGAPRNSAPGWVQDVGSVTGIDGAAVLVSVDHDTVRVRGDGQFTISQVLQLAVLLERGRTRARENRKLMRDYDIPLTEDPA